ncbi:hypothetical protein TNCV_838021, partial [Trichonephila clavipes]
LDDLFKEFERLDSNLSLEESELQEFEERYFYLNAKFNDKLDELNVQNQGEQASSKDCWLIYLLLQKIDPESRRLWAIKSSEEEFPNMKAFLDFLNVRCSSLELMSNNESECTIPIRKILESIFEEEIPALYGKDIDTFELYVDKASSHTSKSTFAYLSKKESETRIKCSPLDDIPVKSPDTSLKEFAVY